MRVRAAAGETWILGSDDASASAMVLKWLMRKNELVQEVNTRREETIVDQLQPFIRSWPIDSFVCWAYAGRVRS